MKLNLHSYHLVTTSPWPFLGSLSLLTLVLSLVARFHGLAVGLLPILALGLFGTVAVTFLWLRDIVREGTLEGSHTAAAQKNLKLGFLLFIGSEIMFFMAFFWGFFHGSLSPGMGVSTYNPLSVPLLNIGPGDLKTAQILVVVLLVQIMVSLIMMNLKIKIPLHWDDMAVFLVFCVFFMELFVLFSVNNWWPHRLTVIDVLHFLMGATSLTVAISLLANDHQIFIFFAYKLIPNQFDPETHEFVVEWRTICYVTSRIIMVSMPPLVASYVIPHTYLFDSIALLVLTVVYVVAVLAYINFFKALILFLRIDNLRHMFKYLKRQVKPTSWLVMILFFLVNDTLQRSGHSPLPYEEFIRLLNDAMPKVEASEGLKTQSNAGGPTSLTLTALLALGALACAAYALVSGHIFTPPVGPAQQVAQQVVAQQVVAQQVVAQQVVAQQVVAQQPTQLVTSMAKALQLPSTLLRLTPGLTPYQWSSFAAEVGRAMPFLYSATVEAVLQNVAIPHIRHQGLHQRLVRTSAVRIMHPRMSRKLILTHLETMVIELKKINGELPIHVYCMKEQAFFVPYRERAGEFYFLDEQMIKKIGTEQLKLLGSSQKLNDFIQLKLLEKNGLYKLYVDTVMKHSDTFEYWIQNAPERFIKNLIKLHESTSDDAYKLNLKELNGLDNILTDHDIGVKVLTKLFLENYKQARALLPNETPGAVDHALVTELQAYHGAILVELQNQLSILSVGGQHLDFAIVPLLGETTNEVVCNVYEAPKRG